MDKNKMPRRKLLAMDLDGTAVKDDYSMCQSSVSAILKAQEHGHIVCFVTGRRDVDMLSLGEEQYCLDYHILNNGGKIVRCKDREVIVNKTIDNMASKELIEYALDNKLQIHIVNGLIWQVSKMTKGTLDYAKTLGVIPEEFSSIDQISYEDLEGLMATADLKPIAEYIDNKQLNMSYIYSEPGTIDIMAKNVSKWAGIQELARIENIDIKDVIAVGNYYNDIDMIEKAGTGIAVANSVEEVKQVADYVTKQDNNHKAVQEIVDLIIKGEFE